MEVATLIPHAIRYLTKKVVDCYKHFRTIACLKSTEYTVKQQWPDLIVKFLNAVAGSGI